MSKVKQIMLVIIFAIIAVLAYSTISASYDSKNAQKDSNGNYLGDTYDDYLADGTEFKVGDTILIGYSQHYLTSNTLFCVEHNQSFNSVLHTYKVVSQVKIVGNVSTDQNGKTITSWHNAKLAYILSSTNSGSSKSSSPIANAIWNYMYTWMNQVGKNHAGLSLDFVSTTKGNSNYSKTLEKEAESYANELQNLEENSFTDNTNKKLLSITSDGSYIKIGPFNWTFSGSLTSIVVKDQNGNAISGVKFSQYTGTTLNTVSVSNIVSGKNFYISIPINSGVTSISSISGSGKVKNGVKTVTIWFLKAMVEYQNLIEIKPGTDDYTFSDEFEYNIDLLGDLKVIKVDKDDNTILLEGVGFKIKNKKTGLYVYRASNGAISYVSESQATEFLTDSNGEILIENLIVGDYIAYETSNPNYGYEFITDGISTSVVVDKTTELVVENDLMTGNLNIVKVNQDNTKVKLQGVGFKFLLQETGLYVYMDSNGEISYVSSYDQATEFITDENGEIYIEELIIGTYIAYETQNPNYGYELLEEGVEIIVERDTTTDAEIGNKQLYVKLSGYVWLDVQSGKTSVRNDLYMDETYGQDDSDILLEDVIVRLKDRTTGETIDSATTKEITMGDNIIRYYQFVDVLIEELENYYIEFEYDGLTYTNVTPYIDLDNGSKAAESTEERDEFNKRFSSIEGESQTTGVALDENDNVAYNLTYEKDTENGTSTLINDGLPVGQFPITANTDETGYIIRDNFEYGMEEIPYINLGLYEREQPDLWLGKDIQNVRLSINGYQHIYEAANKLDNQGEWVEGLLNVGVRFGSDIYDGEYSNPIYRSDVEYYNEEDKSQELEVYVTYKIAILNQSSNLTSRANELIDYYDSRYDIVGVGTGIDEEGNLTGNIEYDDLSTYNDEYNSAIIYTNLSVSAGQEEYIYIQFKLDRGAVEEILNNGELLDNVTEITSYTTFDSSGNVYAGVDTDSNPGNTIPGDKTTYEDDTDKSPALKLVVVDDRELKGKVFLDSTSDELLTGQERVGNGEYDDGETGIPGVEVTFAETKTDRNRNDI